MSQTNTGTAAPGAQPTYTKSDFVSGQEVRWCPGCGDYSILGSMQQALAKFNFPKEKQVFISGIGCSSRFPYYMNTYGFHSIHGRAPAIAAGLRCVNPDLSIWLITGDGDGLSIGGNHLIHAMRRNLNMKICLVNNQIYGLTKGQYSPTSQMGKVTKSSPYGSIDYPINALCLAIASEATFIARTLDSDPRHMISVFERAMKHKGISFIEIYQNCIIFNDKTFAPVTGRDTREDRMVYLEHGKPVIFGKLKNKAIAVRGLNPEVVEFDPANPPAELKGPGKRAEDGTHFLIHNENDPKPNYSYLLTQLTYPEFPVPFGIFRSIEKPTYDEMLDQQVQETIQRKGKGDLKELIYGRDTWTVK